MIKVLGKNREASIMRFSVAKKNRMLEQAERHWKYLSSILVYPSNEAGYTRLVAQLDQLLDYIGDDENHPLIGLVDVVSHLISSYEDKNLHSIKVSGIGALKYLMKIHQLHQTDLTEIGSQGVISEILNGKRKLNLRQIKLLAKRFHVAPITFIDEE